MPDLNKEKIFVVAENGLRSSELFEGRKIFKNNISFSGSIDLWYDRINYGKVDYNNDAIFLSETNLKPLNSNKTLFAVDFVVDAFNDLLGYYESARIRNVLNNQGYFFRIDPVKAWESVSELHHNILQQIYHNYTNQYLQQENRMINVIDFNSFVEEFLIFLANFADNLFVTRTNFILSRYCTPLISGLMIEINDKKYSADIEKINEINDSNFIFYTNAARKYGFLVDKNVPWRLIANVSSIEMKNYMAKRGIIEKNNKIRELFQIYYYQSFFVDIDILKSYLFQMYNSFISTYPYVKEIKERCNKTSLFSTKKRKELSQKSFNSTYGDIYWLIKYFEIRLIEEKNNKNINNLNNLKRRIIDLYEFTNYDTTLKYLNDSLK